MPDIVKAEIERSKLNRDLLLPYQLRLGDFELAMADVYDFFFDVNTNLVEKGLQRLDDMLRPAALSGMLSDMITDSLAQKSRTLTSNLQHNGHPDLIVQDRYPGNSVKAGEAGVEIKATRKAGGAVDTHGARNQLIFREIYIAKVALDDFRRNARGELGTKTATLHAAGVKILREGWVYRDLPPKKSRGKAQPWRQA